MTTICFFDKLLQDTETYSMFSAISSVPPKKHLFQSQTHEACIGFKIMNFL